MNVFSWLDVQNAMKCVKVRLLTVKNLLILLKYIFEFIFNTYAAPQALKRRLSAAFSRENVNVSNIIFLTIISHVAEIARWLTVLPKARVLYSAER